MIRPLVIFITILVNSLATCGQTCCTGAAPITGNFNIVNINKGSASVNISTDLNFINDLLLGNELLNDDYISRATYTIIPQFNYGISPKGTISLVLPYVWLSETVRTVNGSQLSSGSGIGDFTLAYIHQFDVNQRSTVSLGGGIKLPSGQTMARDQDDVIVQATLQPGTGSVDYFFTSQIQASPTSRRSLIIRQNVSVRINGSTSNFTFHDQFKFGNEIQSYTGLSDQIAIRRSVHSPNLTLQYRYQTQFLVDNFKRENTGGHWLNIVPGWIVNLNKTMSAGISTEIPIFRNLNGFQLSTSIRILATLSWTLNRKSNEI